MVVTRFGLRNSHQRILPRHEDLLNSIEVIEIPHEKTEALRRWDRYQRLMATAATPPDRRTTSSVFGENVHIMSMSDETDLASLGAVGVGEHPIIFNRYLLAMSFHVELALPTLDIFGKQRSMQEQGSCTRACSKNIQARPLDMHVLRRLGNLGEQWYTI